MNNRTITGLCLALITSVITMTPVLAQYYVHPYGHPHYHNYGYRGYAPYDGYGYSRPNHTVRNVAIGAGVGAVAGGVIGLLASHHGHNYY